MVKFRVRLTATPGGGNGSFILVPPDVATRLELKGRPKIQAVIAGHPYRGSLMPMGDGTFGLGVLKAIEQAAGLATGDTITVELGLDTAPRVVEPPDELGRELARDPRIAARWEKLSFTGKKEMARGIGRQRCPRRAGVAWLQRWRSSARVSAGSLVRQASSESPDPIHPTRTTAAAHGRLGAFSGRRSGRRPAGRRSKGSSDRCRGRWRQGR